MADLTTTIHSPHGPILSIPGRQPESAAFTEARKHLQQTIDQAQGHLDEMSNWYTTAERGSVRAKRFEDMPWAGPSS